MLPRPLLDQLKLFIARYDLHAREQVPVPIEVIAECEGFRISYVPRLWPLNGYALTLGPIRLMEINADLSLPYRRWTIAHELAHTILRDPSALHLCTDGPQPFVRWLRQRIERQADFAASYLLIPSWVITAYRGDIEEIASRCLVPEELVELRLRVRG